MHMPCDAIKECLDFIESYQKKGIEAFHTYYQELGIPSQPVELSPTKKQQLVDSLSSEMKEAIDYFLREMIERNSELAEQGKVVSCADGLCMRMEPVDSCGIYVPYRFVTSLITWMSAAIAAEVSRIVVYLPVDKKNGLPCPACVYAVECMQGIVYCGPARLGFPFLAFGCQGISEPVNVLCGPAGYRLNILKQLSACISGSRADFFAGPSDLAIVLGDHDLLEQALLDLSAQTEHGADSVGHLIVIGEMELPTATGNQHIHSVQTLAEACELVNRLAPETVELYGVDCDEALEMITNFGVLYCNYPSSLGDYMVIGRGCGDPTNGRASSYAGISPFTFMRHQAIVKDANVDPRAIEHGIAIAAYERMEHHKKAMQNWALMSASEIEGLAKT